MSMFADDRYADRAWDWARDMSRITSPGWQQMYNQNLNATTGGTLSPGSQNVFNFSQQAMAPYTGQQNVLQSDLYRNLEGLYSQWEQPQNITESDLFQNLQSLYDPWAQASDPFQSDMYRGAEQLYQPTVEPLYNQLMPELRRGIEGQYNQQTQQMLGTGVRGGALSDMLASAAMGRSENLGDMERSLRSQDIARLDQTQRERAAALSGIAQNVYGTQQAGMQNRANQLTGLGQNLGALDQQAMMQRANALGAGSQNLEQMYGNRGLMANQYLSGLLNQLSASDADRAQNMANMGMQGRYLTGNQLSQSEAGANAGLMGGLMNMGSMLGMGMGMSGGLGGLFGGGTSDPMSAVNLGFGMDWL